jgi:hypothetical protein
VNGLPISSIISSNELTKLNSSESLALLTNLSSSTIDASSIQALAKNIPTNTALASVVGFTSFVPIQLIASTNSLQLASLVSNMDLNDISNGRAGFISSQVCVRS